MRIVIDLDGTICELRRPEQSYADVALKPGVADALKQMKAQGHQVIIYTSRHMKTCEHNPGLVLARVGKVTLDWLARHGIPYDEIHFGKPQGDVYIDDLAHPFTDWKAALQHIDAKKK